MSVSAEEVRKVARLSRIAVTEEEVPALAAELSGILGWIGQLFEVDVEGVAPMASAADITLALREEDIARATSRLDVLGNAPETRDGCFAVPKVVE